MTPLLARAVRGLSAGEPRLFQEAMVQLIPCLMPITYCPVMFEKIKNNLAHNPDHPSWPWGYHIELTQRDPEQDSIETMLEEKLVHLGYECHRKGYRYFDIVHVDLAYPPRMKALGFHGFLALKLV